MNYAILSRLQLIYVSQKKLCHIPVDDLYLHLQFRLLVDSVT